MLKNKSHRSVVSTCVLIFMPYFKKIKNKKKNKKQGFFLKTLVFFAKKKTRSEKNCFFFLHHYANTNGISSGSTSVMMLMESVLALEVGAAAKRTLSKAIMLWGSVGRRLCKKNTHNLNNVTIIN